MFCGQCGAAAHASDLYCGTCGALLWASSADAPPSAPARRRVRAPHVLTVAVVCLLIGSGIAFASAHGGGTSNGHGVAAPLRTHSTAPSTPSQPTSAAGTSAAATSADFAAIYAREHSGVVRIETLSCSDSGIGTGFLISPTLVVTVDHVVDRSVVVSLVDGSQRAIGTVIGADAGRDVALVRADRPLSGYRLRIARTSAAIGDAVATIGFPIGNPITLTHGDVSGLGRDVTVDGTPLTGMLETDATVDPGNSGGPLLDEHGDVVGLIDAPRVDADGIGYAVPAAQAGSLLAQWQQTPTAVPPGGCSAPLGPSQAQVDVPPPGPGALSTRQAAGVVSALNTYFQSINSGAYPRAYAVLSPRLQAATSEAAFADGDATSYDTGQTVLAADAIDAQTVHVALAFTSLQRADKGPDGDTCDNWTLLYTLVQTPARNWQIDATAEYNGVPQHVTC